MIKSVETTEELEELFPILQKFYALMPYEKHYENLETNWISRWEGLISSGNGEIFILTQKNKIIGGIGFLFHPSLEDGVLCCTEAFWYVDEKFRGKGLSLLLHLQKYAKQKGAKRMFMIHLSNSMPEQLKGLYTRLGYKEAETIYIKEL